MNFEGGMILLLGVIFGVPLLLGLLYLINRVAGRTLIPLWLPLVLLVVLPVAGSFYLDRAGEVHSVKVVHKTETIKYQLRGEGGTWMRQLSVQVEHPWEDRSLTPYLSMSADAATYDGLRVGQTAEVRVLELGSLFKFGRFAHRSTLSMVADWVPRAPHGPWREATATVEQIVNYTEYVERSQGTRWPLRWPYQIVRMGFTPPGRTEPVEVVDTIEIGSVPGVAENAVVRISWPEDDPRAARIAGARPGRPWANWFSMMGEELAIGAAVVAVLLVFSLWQRRRNARKEATPAASI